MCTYNYNVIVQFIVKCCWSHNRTVREVSHIINLEFKHNPSHKTISIYLLEWWFHDQWSSRWIPKS